MNAYQTIVIGAGQAGLAVGRALQIKNSPFLILDENEEAGWSWKKRYDSLKLFTPKNYSHLFNDLYQGDEKEFPSRDEVADYLSKFQDKYNLPIKVNEKVINLSKNDDQMFTLCTENRKYTAKNVIVATGAFYTPFIPAIHDSSIPFMIHSADYKNPDQIPEGDVLIVGGGNTGIQIAAELSKSLKHHAYLSRSKKLKRLPKTILGNSLFWWLDQFKILNASPNSFIGKRLKDNDPLIGNDISVIKRKGTLLPRLTRVSNKNAYFQNTFRKQFKALIWATGYRNDYSWINIKEAIDEQGQPVHQLGISTVKGLYYVGLSWQSKRGSALLYGVTEDAEKITEVLIKNN
ncbi:MULTISPECIES: flavin-containing monooxygenase [Bacillaceae]|nr:MULTISPECIES: NAD(P)/FAD-dependent oxidoreductase [Bacillaceae]